MTGKQLEAHNWDVSYCFLYTFDQASKSKERSERFFDGQVKWKDIYNYMMTEPALVGHIEWLKNAKKPLVLLKNKSRSIMNYLNTQNPLAKFRHCGKSTGAFAPLIPGAVQFLTDALQKGSESRIRRMQAQVIEPIERFWYSLLNCERDLPLFCQLQMKRVAEFRAKVYNSKTPQDLVVPAEIRINEDFRQAMLNTKGRHYPETATKKMELIERYGYKFQEAIAQARKSLQKQGFALCEEHARKFEEAEKLCVEHIKEQQTALAGLTKDVAEMKEQVAALVEAMRPLAEVTKILTQVKEQVTVLVEMKKARTELTKVLVEVREQFNQLNQANLHQ